MQLARCVPPLRALPAPIQSASRDLPVAAEPESTSASCIAARGRFHGLDPRFRRRARGRQRSPCAQAPTQPRGRPSSFSNWRISALRVSTAQRRARILSHQEQTAASDQFPGAGGGRCIAAGLPSTSRRRRGRPTDMSLLQQSPKSKCATSGWGRKKNGPHAFPLELASGGRARAD